jgi:hypothetical protein
MNIIADFIYEEVKLEINSLSNDFIQLNVNSFNESHRANYVKIKLDKTKTVDLKTIVKKIYVHNNFIYLTKLIQGASVFDVINYIFDIQREDTGEFNITRTQLLSKL